NLHRIQRPAIQPRGGGPERPAGIEPANIAVARRYRGKLRVRCRVSPHWLGLASVGSYLGLTASSIVRSLHRGGAGTRMAGAVGRVRRGVRTLVHQPDEQALRARVHRISWQLDSRHSRPYWIAFGRTPTPT